MLEVLDKFTSLKPPLAAVLELLPRLTTRFYSISSSPLAADSIHLTVAVVRYKTDANVTDREGVASTWFERMREGANLEIFMRTSDFHLPVDNQKPVIMVGPGTGLAPFRGFILDRQEEKKQGKAGGPLVMIFGCRSKTYDYIYQSDLEAAEADGTLSNLLCAFSRDQKQKVYVQNMIEQNHDMLWDMLGKEDGYFYVCGDAKEMARDVMAALATAFEQAGGMALADAEKKIQDMKKKDRIKLDVWA